MIKRFKKPESLFFIMPFSTDMSLDFCIFLATWENSKISNTSYQVRDGQGDDQTDKKETLY